MPVVVVVETAPIITFYCAALAVVEMGAII
jgi:hypothetical protein